MSGYRTKRITALSLALGVAFVAPLAADPMIPYDEALVPTESLEGRRAAPLDPVLADEFVSILSVFSGSDAAGRENLLEDIHTGSSRPFVKLAGENKDKIQAYIHLRDSSDDAIAALESAGVEIEIVSKERPLVQGYIPIDSAQAVSDLPFVREVTLPSYGIATAGQVISEGALVQLNTLIFSNRRNPDESTVDGTGTMVGVISNGLFSSAPTKCSPSLHFQDGTRPFGHGSDLPIGRLFPDCSAVPSAQFFGDVEIFPALLTRHTTGGALPEGTAMMEVIHDIAPGAGMVYATAATSLELELARGFLMLGEYKDPLPANVNKRGLDVIADNLFFVGEGRYDGSSAISRGATAISRQHNLPYVVTAGGVTPTEAGSTMAGNFPLQITNFFNGDPRDTRVKAHSWSEGQSSLRDEALNMTTDSSGRISATLVWDDIWDDAAPRATIDLDMYLVPRSTLALTQAVAASVRLQNGQGSNPVERISYIGPQSDLLALVIVNKSNKANSKPLFTLVIENGIVNESDYLTHAIALNNSDALKPVITVADVSMLSANPNDLLSDSVVPGRIPGGTHTQSFLRWYEDQVFPTAVNYSGVSTVVAGRNGFTGASAAVAHTAGMVSLLRHRFPEMPPSQIWTLFQDTSGLNDSGDPILPVAIDVTPNVTKGFHNRPKYNLVRHYSLYNALNDGQLSAYPSIGAASPVLVAQTTNEDGVAAVGHWGSDWQSSDEPGSEVFDVPEYRASELGLELKPASDNSYGYWASPVLAIQGAEDEAPRTELRTDRVYVVEARVGTTASDPLRVPDFRLRIASANGDESASLVISGVTPGAESAPSNIGGNTYHVYYRPSNAEVAKQGVKFYFELINFDPNDDVDASVILRDFTLRELPLPEASEQ